jgi:hypothetical protein
VLERGTDIMSLVGCDTQGHMIGRALGEGPTGDQQADDGHGRDTFHAGSLLEGTLEW